MWASPGEFPWEAWWTSFITGKIICIRWFPNESNVNWVFLSDQKKPIPCFNQQTMLILHLCHKAKHFWANLWGTAIWKFRQCLETIMNINSENLPGTFLKWLVNLVFFVLSWTLELPLVDTKCQSWPCWLVTADANVECHIHAWSKEIAILRRVLKGFLWVSFTEIMTSKLNSQEETKKTTYSFWN